MIDTDDAGQILAEMVEIVRAFQAARNRSLSRGVTGTKFGALQQLRCGDIRTTELAERLLVSLPVASRTVAALEEDGFVVRRRDPSDARASLLSITDAGRESISSREAYVVSLFTDALADWTPEQAAQATAVLGDLRERLTGVLETLPHPPAADAATTNLSKDRV
ncbi:MAG: MarR family transcriptional regulator [Gordonia sp. (in: high G+C Gram-positive bacteria)]|uniref:MarR family winged helix-turn-helix transcriptional regulator n=1 Tax=Gordonia TaxID=2053 RepID=UPI00326593AF